MNTRDEIRDAVERYGRECQNAVESFRCAEPDLDAVMALIEPHLVIAEAARKWVASRPKGGVAAVAIGGTVHTVATYEQVKAEAALRAAVELQAIIVLIRQHCTVCKPGTLPRLILRLEAMRDEAERALPPTE